ncbi:MAG: hypothetical protein V7703_07520 [Hyphomicrobiales bacterium]
MTIEPVIESDNFEFLRSYALAENILSFQLPIGLPDESGETGLLTKLIDPRDVPPGLVYFGQLRGRTLPVAVAKFADQVAKALTARFL